MKRSTTLVVSARACVQLAQTMLVLTATATLLLAAHACSDGSDEHAAAASRPHASIDAAADAEEDAAVVTGPQQVMPCFCIASLHITKDATCGACVGATQTTGKACEGASDACQADSHCLEAKTCLDHCKASVAACFGACFLPRAGDSAEVLAGKKLYEKLADCYCPPCADACAYDEPFACLVGPGPGDAGSDGGP